MWLLKALAFLLTFVGTRGNCFELSDLINRIHKESDLATVNFIGFDGGCLIEFMKTHSNIPVAIFTSLRGDNNKGISHNDILVLHASSEIHQYSEILQQFILRLRVRKFVIISANHDGTLQEYFSYFRKNKFTRIFGIIENIPYAYLPFEENPVQKLSKTNALPDAFRNLNGFKSRTSLMSDIPRVFRYTNYDGHRMIGGYVGQIFLSFLKKHNATFTIVGLHEEEGEFMNAALKATANGYIDISLNAYEPNKVLDQSYPIKFMKWAIMVPINGYVPPDQYFLRPFSTKAWIWIGFTLAYIIVMDVFKDIFLNLPANFWHSFSRTVLTFLFMSPERPITSAYRFHCQVLVLAFILVNLYLIHLTSFLTVFISVKQYNTIQDLIDNNVPVMMVDYEWKAISGPGQSPAGFDKIATPVDHAVYTREKNSMRNTSFAYALGEDKAEFLVRLHSIFAKPQFHTIRDCLEYYYLGFLMIMDTGLIEKWTKDAVMYSAEAGLEDVAPPSDRLMKPLTLHHLRFPLTCLSIGLAIATVVLFSEMLGGIFAKIVFKR